MADAPKLFEKPAPKPASKPEPMLGDKHETETETETDAATRLRAFEDKHIGKDAVRMGGKIERGVGSQYSRLTEPRKREYEAIEKLVASEAKLAEAHGALVAADAEHEEAMEAAARAEAEPDAPAAE